MEKCAFLVVHESISEDGNYSKETIIMLICLNDLFARLGLTRTCKLLTKLSKNSFYLLPDSLRLGDFFTNYRVVLFLFIDSVFVCKISCF